ncbi:MAG: hypothetical protein EAZ20_07570, partial [Bacteroidetes bacterium]
ANLTTDDGLSIRKKVERVLTNYQDGLKLLGEVSNTTKNWVEQDIDDMINNLFIDRNVKVFNDLSRVRNADNEYLGIGNYLGNIGVLYSQGITFNYGWNIKNPCELRDNEGAFFKVKVEIQKKISGTYSIDNGLNINEDSLDIYVRIPISQFHPKLVLGDAKIMEIVKHTNAECKEFVVKAEFKLSLFEEEILRKRAENFVRDYAITLDFVGNERINDRYNVLDYFESKKTPVYNDLFPHILKNSFEAEEYLGYIESWFQRGMRFRYSFVRATNLIEDSLAVTIEVEVTRNATVAQKGFKNTERMSVFVKFPYDFANKYVAAERITPRISKIVERKRKTNPRNYWSVNGSVFMANYFGDLNANFQPFTLNQEQVTVGGSIGISKKLTPHFSLSFGFAIAQIRGDDSRGNDVNDNLERYRYIRNLHFRNTLREFSLTGTYDFLSSKGLFYRRRAFTPYVSAGVGLLFHNPQARTPIDFGAAWIDLKPLNTEGQGKQGYPKSYSLRQLIIPLVLGVKIKYNSKIDICFETGFRFTFTDYLDDVSGNYPNMWDLDSDLAKIMSNRSLEQTAATTGASRVQNLAQLTTQLNGELTYIGDDGRTYKTFNGYGRSTDQRGGAKVNDMYMFTGIKVHYLIGVGKQKTEPVRKRISFQFQ